MVRVQVLVRLVRGTENCSAGYIFSLTRPQAAGAAGGGWGARQGSQADNSKHCE